VAYGVHRPDTTAANGSDSMPLATTNTSLSPGSMSSGTTALVVITLVPVPMPIEVTVAPLSSVVVWLKVRQ